MTSAAAWQRLSSFVCDNEDRGGRNDGAVSVTTTTCLALNTGYSYIYQARRTGGWERSETKNLLLHLSPVNVRVCARARMFVEGKLINDLTG